VTVQITQICTVTGLSKRASMAVQNSGYGSSSGAERKLQCVTGK